MKPKKAPPAALSTLERLNETLEMLEKKERLLQKKISLETEKAKNFTKSKNKKAAIQCLKRKKLLEAQMEQIGNFQLRVHDQMIMLEGVKATTDTIDALKTGASAVKSIQLSLNVDDIDNTIEEMNEHTENMKQIQEALGAPLGSAAGIDEDELEAELEELEEEDLEQLQQPPNTTPVVSLPSANHPNRDKLQPAGEDDELASLQAEMAL